MKRWLWALTWLWPLLASAQEYGGVTLDTNANTVTPAGGSAIDVSTPAGAFFLGFGLVVGWCVVGWSLRLVRWVGHRD